MITLPMTDAQFAAASIRFRKNGVDIQGNTGTLSKDGITAKYEHSNGVLTVEVLDRPFFLPLSMIEGRLQGYFEQSMAAGDTPSAA